MRTILTASLVVAALLSTTTATQAQTYATVVDTWYHRYLGRHADRVGFHDHVHALRHGTPAIRVEAAILSSPEYYARCGNCAEGYVIGLYRDVLGRTPCEADLVRWTRHLRRTCRHDLALDILAMRSTPIVVERPVLVDRPLIVERPVVVTPRPVVVTPAPIYAPSYHSYYDVSPGFSFSLRIAR
jgi:hypothetical protein